jgi:hypothetical protein
VADPLAESWHVTPERTHPIRGSARSWRAAACALAVLVVLAACAGADGSAAQGTPQKRASTGAVDAARDEASNAPLVTAPVRVLPGAGAVAFDPSHPRVAWAAGEEIRMLDLGLVSESRYPVGAWVTDVGFAPDGALWVVAGDAQLWRDGALVCRADVEVDRLLGIDAQGAVAAGYTHADGTGMSRHQVWLDASCNVSSEQTDPVPSGVTDAEADLGAPLRRPSLRPPRMSVAADGSSPPADLPKGARPIAASADGRWWVVEDAAGRALWTRQTRP